MQDDGELANNSGSEVSHLMNWTGQLVVIYRSDSNEYYHSSECRYFVLIKIGLIDPKIFKSTKNLLF